MRIRVEFRENDRKLKIFRASFEPQSERYSRCVQRIMSKGGLHYEPELETKEPHGTRRILFEERL
jgi:hypothetical protein